MRNTSVAAIAALLVCSCGPKALELPADPIDRAATCGVFTAAEARSATDIQKPLPFEAQLRILDHALIAGSSGDSFSPEAATQVSRRMSELQGGITEGKWQDLKAPCDAAYPQLAKADVALPADRFQAQLGCDSLADFVLTALEKQESDYVNALAEYRALRARLNVALGPGMQRRAGTDIEKQQAERRKALARVVKLGPTEPVMKQCLARYG